jgi:DNA invertase Pin-like site-specific DNA recombinase
MKTYDSLIRVSKMNGRAETADSTLTINDQEAANRRAVKDAGGRIGKTFKALDQSGFSVHQSRAWQTAVERIRQGQSDGIVVAYDDRLGRNWRKAGPFYDAMEQAGGEILISAMPGVDYRTDEGRAMTGMLAVVSEMTYNAAKKRGDQIADRTVENGVPNRVPYGYRRNERKGVKTDRTRHAKALVPDKHAATTVKRIYRMRAAGESWTGIADTLNQAGVPSPTGRYWTVQTLCGIVANETYLGVVTLGDRRLEDAHKPLVTVQEWRAAQQTRTVTRNGKLVSGLAGAVLVCSGCGKPMRVHGSHGRPFYGCARRSADGPCPAPTNVSKPAADRFVDRVVVRAIEGGKLQLLASARELDTARKTLDDATSYRKAWHRVQGTVPDREWREEYEQRQQAERHAADAYEEQLTHAAVVEDLPAVADAWHALDVPHQRRVARSLIDSVVVAPPASRSRYANVADRFTVRFHGLVGAGR